MNFQNPILANLLFKTDTLFWKWSFLHKSKCRFCRNRILSSGFLFWLKTICILTIFLPEIKNIVWARRKVCKKNNFHIAKVKRANEMGVAGFQPILSETGVHGWFTRSGLSWLVRTLVWVFSAFRDVARTKLINSNHSTPSHCTNWSKSYLAVEHPKQHSLQALII